MKELVRFQSSPAYRPKRVSVTRRMRPVRSLVKAFQHMVKLVVEEDKKIGMVGNYYREVPRRPCSVGR